MKAIAYDNGPDSLYLTEVADPVPAAGEVIIDAVSYTHLTLPTILRV